MLKRSVTDELLLALRAANRGETYNACPGDNVLVSGSLGDHGIAVMIVRESLDMELDVVIDTAALHGLICDLLERVPNIQQKLVGKGPKGWASLLPAIERGAASNCHRR